MKVETDGEDCIVCPFCGVRDEEYTDYPHALRFDGDKADAACSECGKSFTVTLCAEYTYQSRGSDEQADG